MAIGDLEEIGYRVLEGRDPGRGGETQDGIGCDQPLQARHDLRTLMPRRAGLLWSHSRRPGEAFADPRAERGLHRLNPGAVIRPDLEGLDDTKDLHPLLEPLDADGDLTGRANDSTDAHHGCVE